MYYLRNLVTEEEIFDFTPTITSLKIISFWQLTFKHWSWSGCWWMVSNLKILEFQIFFEDYIFSLDSRRICWKNTMKTPGFKSWLEFVWRQIFKLAWSLKKTVLFCLYNTLYNIHNSIVLVGHTDIQKVLQCNVPVLFICELYNLQLFNTSLSWYVLYVAFLSRDY